MPVLERKRSSQVGWSELTVMTRSRGVWLRQEHSPATNLPFSPAGYLPYLSVLHPARLCFQLHIPGFCFFIIALQLLPKIHLYGPNRKTLHPPYALTPCPSVSFSSLPAPVLPAEEPQSLQPSNTEWELHKNNNLCSSPTCLLIQLSFLAFASSFLQALRSLPVQLQLLFSFHWNLLRFLNHILRDISFPNNKSSTEDTRNETLNTPPHEHPPLSLVPTPDQQENVRTAHLKEQVIQP